MQGSCFLDVPPLNQLCTSLCTVLGEVLLTNFHESVLCDLERLQYQCDYLSSFDGGRWTRTTSSFGIQLFLRSLSNWYKVSSTSLYARFVLLGGSSLEQPVHYYAPFSENFYQFSRIHLSFVISSDSSCLENTLPPRSKWYYCAF
jgi:hypothetical protein